MCISNQWFSFLQINTIVPLAKRYGRAGHSLFWRNSGDTSDVLHSLFNVSSIISVSYFLIILFNLCILSISLLNKGNRNEYVFLLIIYVRLRHTLHGVGCLVGCHERTRLTATTLNGAIIVRCKITKNN